MPTMTTRPSAGDSTELGPCGNRRAAGREKLEDEDEGGPCKKGRNAPAQRGQHRRDNRHDGQKWPAFAGDDRMRVGIVHRGAYAGPDIGTGRMYAPRVRRAPGHGAEIVT